MTSCSEGDSPVDLTYEWDRRLARLDICLKGTLGDRTYLAEEFFECIGADDVRVGFETGFTESFLQEFGHFKTNAKEFPTLLFLCSHHSQNGKLVICIWDGLTAAYLSSNVDGSILGKSLSATGSRISMNGTMTKTAKGMRRRRSVVVRFNCSHTKGSKVDFLSGNIFRPQQRRRLTCLRSLLVKLSPCRIFHCSLAEILTSFANSFEPCQ